jgi:hypothetical protein
MTDPGLKCRGYQFKADEVNTCDAATCVREGFHAAENPLDCFSYYHSFENSEFWLCLADGEIHEDQTDTKLSCTELVFVKRLELFEMAAFGCQYILRNPKRKLSERVKRDMGQTDSNGYVIVIGENPLGGCACGGKAIGLVRTDESGTPVEFAVLTEDAIEEGKIYNMAGEEVAEL